MLLINSFQYFLFHILTIVSSSFCVKNSVENLISNDSLFYEINSFKKDIETSLKVKPINNYHRRFATAGPSPLVPSIYSYSYQFHQLGLDSAPVTVNKDDRNTIETNLNPIVWIKDGGLKGFTMQSIKGAPIYAFRSIPFAQPPIGNLRFQAPLKNSPWYDIRNAVEESPTCLQTDFIRQYAVIGNEDCLYLNVYTPKVPKSGEASNLGVMVFIHGGGFFFGSSNLYGPAYLLDENVILVSMNYRLGPFGFLSTGDAVIPGNNGLKDQTMALQWVRENIHAFGGDPSKVTIFGESAGAGSVHLHMFSQLSKGLFHAGISQSGCAFCSWSIVEKAVELGRTFAKSFNCSTKNSKCMVECLKKIDGETLVKGQHQFLKWSMYPVVIFGPVVEPKLKGSFLDENPLNKLGYVTNVPWLTGYNANEGGLNIATALLNPQDATNLNENWDNIGPIFLDLEDKDCSVKLAKQIREYYLDNREISFENRKNTSSMFGDRHLTMCGMRSISHHYALSNQPVYGYHFNYVGDYGLVQLIGQKAQDWGPVHLDELIYLLNNTLYYPDLKITDEEYEISKIVTNLWANFAKTRKPVLTIPSNGIEPDVWKPIDIHRSTTIQLLDISLTPKMIDSPFHERLTFWNSLSMDET